MIESCDEILGEHLRVVEHVLDWAHRRAGHTLAEELLPFERTARGEGGARDAPDRPSIIIYIQ